MSQSPEFAQCDGTLPRGVVNTLNAGTTSYSDYDPVSVSYYTGTVWPAVAPSIVGLCLYAALLLFWIIWRSVKNCRCCGRRSRTSDDTWGQGLVYERSEEGAMVPVPSHGAESGLRKQGGGSRSSSKGKVDIVASAAGRPDLPVYAAGGGRPSIRQARRQLFILTGAVVMGLGVMACSIYGLATVRPAIVTDSVAVINGTGRGYVEGVLRVVQEVVSVGNALDDTLTGIENTLGDGGLTSVLVDLIDSDNVVETTVASIQGQLRVLLQDAEETIASAEETVLGSIDDAVGDFEPIAQQYNTYRFIGMYVLYGLVIALVLVVLAMALVRWPLYHSLSLFLFMVIMTVVCAVMVGHTFGVKVAGDSCDNLNLEVYVLSELVDDPQTRDIIEFYLSEGRDTSRFSDVYDLANVAFDVDVREILNVVEMAKQSVEVAIRDNGLQGEVLESLLQEEVDTARAQADEISLLITSVIDMIEPQAVMNGPYADMRGFLCCSSVDDVGEWWLGLTLTISFGFAFVLFAFWVTHMLDSLPLGKWNQRYVTTPRSFA